ncbi:MAG: trigger factor, partial [Chloroflexi bacterium]|nr:trigger factor [Chloroflexota bacterium]
MDAPKTTVEALGPSRKRLQVEIDASTVQAEIDRAFALVGRQARLPGFRPGKAPRRVLERMFGEQVRRDVLGRLVEESFHHAVHEHQLAVVGSPEIDADVLTPGEALRYSATVDVRPDIALTEIGGIDVVRPAAVVGDEDVQRVLDSLRESVAQLRPITDRQVVEAGDVVTLDLASRMEGAEPVRREGVLLEAGGGSFPLALERQLVGQHRGAHLTFDVPYPAEYSNPSLAGRSVQFDVQIVDLRAKELPDLDDDFARDHGRSETLDELRGRIRADLERQAHERAEGAVREAILDQVLARHPFEVPASLVERRCEAMLATLDVRLPPGAGEGEALARLREQLRPRAERDVRADLLLDAVAERDGLVPDDQAVTQ